MNERIVENFLSLCAIPHKSHHEEALSRFLYDWGVSRGLSAVRDAAGNVILSKDGSEGCRNAPRAILQAHMDMVAVAAEGVDFDPLRDPISVINDGETLRADGTSLGGDDGAGVALAMSILEDDDAVHGPIRAIFTVDEEDGMSGAMALAPEHLDAKYLINLDWEGFGSLCCSSAGSEMYAFRREVRWEDVEDESAFSLSIQALESGHSGSQIHLGRANAIRLAARILQAGLTAAPGLRLTAFRGGSAHNAIPGSCSAAVVLPREQEEAFLAAARAAADAALEGCALTDPNAVVSLLRSDVPGSALSSEDGAALLELLCTLHDGVNTMSSSIPGLVESSSNIGLAGLDGEQAEFIVHQRSSEPSITTEMHARFIRLAAGSGFRMDLLSSSPPWPVRPNSPLVEMCRRHFRENFGSEIRVEPVHAGLECGCFSNKNPALDIISIGPDLFDIHTPRETLVLRSVYDCDTLIRSMLREIAAQ